MTNKGFNLLKKQKEPPTTWDRMYGWITGTARVVVIIVEILIIAAFVVRIVLDTQGNNIDKDIEKRNGAIGAMQEEEARFRNIHSRISSYNELWTSASSYAETLNELEGFLGNDFEDTSINIDGDSLTINGQGNVDKISNLEEAMKNSQKLKNVSVSNINTDETNSTRASFAIKAIILNPNTRSF